MIGGGYLVLFGILLAAAYLAQYAGLTGALLGSALLVFLPPAVTNLGTAAGLDGTQAAQLAPFVYGVVLILVMLLAPSGAVGVVKKVWARSSTRRTG